MKSLHSADRKRKKAHREQSSVTYTTRAALSQLIFSAKELLLRKAEY
jgi:hypothetical protein